MELAEILANVHIVGIPTRTNFRGVSLREIALLHHDGRWAEFSPFSDYSIERDSLWLQGAIDALEKPLPPAKRSSVKVNATLPEVPISRVGEVLSWFPGSSTVKIKIGTRDDEERIAEVFRIIPGARLRLDANGLFSIQEAENFLTQLYNTYEDAIEYVEQPCATLAEIKVAKLPIPIAIDENVRLGDDVREINEVADVVIIKVGPLGGITRSLRTIDQLDKPVVISSALESSIGISQGIALAAHLPDDVTCGLGTVALLDGDISQKPLTPHDGKVPVSEITVDLKLVEKYQLNPERNLWWHNRISAAYTKMISDFERGVRL